MKDPQNKEHFDGSVLYHYTDSNALVSLLGQDKPSLWASEAGFLNDATELRVGRVGLIDELRRQAAELRNSSEPLESPMYDWSRSTRAGVMEYVAHELATPITKSTKVTRVFVACFCEHGDLLSQWRSYGQGGYALGFDRKMIAELAPIDFTMSDEIRSSHKYFSQQLEARLANVNYVTSVSNEVVRDLIDQSIDQSPPPSTGFSSLRGMWETLYRLANLKDAAFSEEREVRSTFILQAGSNYDYSTEDNATVHVKARQLRAPVHFRTTNATLVPYVKLGFPRGAIKEVRVGPSGHQEQRITAIEALLHEIDREDINVIASRIPYRS